MKYRVTFNIGRPQLYWTDELNDLMKSSLILTILKHIDIEFSGNEPDGPPTGGKIFVGVTDVGSFKIDIL